MGKRADRRRRRKMAREQKKFLKKTAYHNIFHETHKNMDYIFRGLTNMEISDKNFKLLGTASIGNLSTIPMMTL